MIEDIEAQPHQIGDALWRVDGAGISRRDLPGGLVVCGMGGSAVGGDLAAAALSADATRPVVTARGYELGPWIGPDHLVLCASHSGSTEETLSCYDAAGRLGADRVVLTTGGELADRARADGVAVIGVPSGMQPRAAVVYMTVAALKCAEACGAATAVGERIEAAVPTLEAVIADRATVDELARSLKGTIPVVYGAAGDAAIARRWKNQLNENAKAASFAGEVPEICHNEIEGWATGRATAPLASVLLATPGAHPRNARRLDVLAERLGAIGVPVVRPQAVGDDRIANVMSLVTLGDLVSVRVAELTDVDPDAIEAIEGFKAAL